MPRALLLIHPFISHGTLAEVETCAVRWLSFRGLGSYLLPPSWGWPGLWGPWEALGVQLNRMKRVGREHERGSGGSEGHMTAELGPWETSEQIPHFCSELTTQALWQRLRICEFAQGQHQRAVVARTSP